MAHSVSQPDRLFDRPWRPGHPFQPRLCLMRRWGMPIVLLLLGAVIGGYWYITDSSRVRDMAESYLSKVLGGPVEVGSARLSIFEGLRLEDVTVRVDQSKSDDSIIFTAQTFLIKYNPRSMLKGRLDATQIVAIDPHVSLTENLDTGKWNYQRLVREDTGPTSLPSSGDKDIRPPEILLRNAQFDYSEIRNGKFIPLGSMAIEGRLWPGSEASRYNFELQSRGESEGVGPVVSGSVVLNTGQVNLRLEKFKFGPDIRSLLPAQVRTWWEKHELEGRVDIPELSFVPPRNGRNATFRVETELDGVTLAVRPEEWNSREENDRIASIRRSLKLIQRSGLNGGGVVEPFREMFNPPPIKVERVSGTFVFTQDGIDIKRVSGRVETNAFAGRGRIEGYSPDAAAYFQISSPQTENIYIPHSPRYVNSLPPQVREVYDRFRPEGTCRVWIELNRDKSGTTPRVTGEIEIVDGKFIFDHFPYPVRNATGRIVLGTDPSTGRERLDIQDLRGRGAEGGPNQNCHIFVNGHITPFGATAGVQVTVEGRDISSEPLLRAAFPPETQEALRLLDPDGKGNFPVFRGSFLCNVIRPEGHHTRWTINTDINLEDASGALVAFPYPMEHVKAKLHVREGYMQIIDGSMQRGDATLSLNGRVNFGHGGPATPDLTIKAVNVPIDQQLLDALPADRRQWLQKIGLQGKLDIEGRVFVEPAVRATTRPHGAMAEIDNLGMDLKIRLHDGSLWPVEGMFAVSNLSGDMVLTPHRLGIKQLTGLRGQAQVKARGAISWDDNNPRVVLNASATDLLLDSSLYKLLPKAAQAGWDQVRPQGTVDAEINYSGQFTQPTTAPAGAAPASADAASTSAKDAMSSAGSGYEVVLHPRQLSITPDVLPYQLDDLKGTITFLADKVLLADMTARHGKATVRFGGTGKLGESSTWDLKLAADDLPVDDQLRKALPKSISALIDNLKISGKLSFAFDKLLYQNNGLADPDIDFSTQLSLDEGRLEVGMLMSDVRGAAQLSGTVRHGKLAELHGTVDLPKLKIAGRSSSHFHAQVDKSADEPRVRLGRMRANLAGGDMAGQVEVMFPDDGPSSYAMSLLLRNASVAELAGEHQPELQGQVSASLDLEGRWDDPNSRRGRGDVSASGKNMYRIPVVLGLLQVANLSLPISSPFTEAGARYMVQGQTVTFENISLRSSSMVMQGTGSLDFNTRKVNLTFTTDNPNWPKLPFIQDLIEGARHELLQIHVRGTIQDPKVSATAMNTVTTTVDEVFREDR